MIKEIFYFLRYGPNVKKQQQALGPVAFMRKMAIESDADGYGALRNSLVSDLVGEVLEVGAGTGATFPYYGPEAKVTAIEPDDAFRAAAAEAAKSVRAQVRVIAGQGEKIPFADNSFDFVSGALVLCSVTSPEKTLAEFRRVLRPGGQIRLMEHVRSDHWLAGPVMALMNPIWLRINKIGCNWDRKTVASVEQSGFSICSVESYKVYSKSAPAAFPIRLIKAERPA